MALIDSEAGEIVIRVVYDGPPEAGKTTSLRALAGSLARPAYTPAEDVDGRTLWFDWMEYVGGRFEGCQIRCQIVSVPGQRALGARRRRIVQDADVVVFVCDSSTAALPQTLAYLLELRDMLGRPADAASGAAGAAGIPVGVIVQANKRDLADAVPLDELRGQLDRAGWPIGVVESVAADGTGIREAFVYAVRLALDRVRELMNRSALPSAMTGPASAGELLDALRAADHVRRADAPAIIETGPGSVAATLLREVLACEHDAPRAAHPDGRAPPDGAPCPPDASVPSGAIWPPVEGRSILSELAQAGLVPRRLPSGDWIAGLGSGWRVVSGRDATFSSLDQGRAALIQWARLHASANGAVSPARCIVLADSGLQVWRLWQIVRAEASLRDAIDLALREPTADRLIAELGRVAMRTLDADDRLAGVPLDLACTLDTLGVIDGVAAYIGLMPETLDANRPPATPRASAEPRALIARLFAPAIERELASRGVDLDDALSRIVMAATASTSASPRRAG
jgi:signal recognition particle receptor subunit beta